MLRMFTATCSKTLHRLFSTNLLLSEECQILASVEHVTCPDGLVEDDNGFVLIERHLDVADGYFSSDVLSTGVENEDDPDANTYCVIGALNQTLYQQEGGYYDLKLIYKYSDNTEDVLEWTQTSWITEGSVTGANLSKIVDDESDNDGERFRGLALSPRSQTYLDGNGADHDNWFHAVASTTAWNGGIPGHEGNAAYSSSLWIQPGTLSKSLVYLMKSRGHCLDFSLLVSNLEM